MARKRRLTDEKRNLMSALMEAYEVQTAEDLRR